jgi:uncharacterized protein (DUF697 family)
MEQGMPELRLSPRGAFSTLNSFRNFMSLIREMSFVEEREQAEHLPRVLIIATDTESGRRLGDALTGSPGTAPVTVWTLDAATRNSDAFDVVIVHNPATNATYRQAKTAAGSDPLRVFDIQAEGDEETWQSHLRQRIASTLPDLAPALGRWFPAFRPAATKAVIDETARVNAQFSLLSNVPAAIPIVGSLASVGADFFILTKNQVMMVFKIAAINGRDLSDHWAIVRELLPVVGAGFLWRTLAREAASFIPFMAGTVPKVAIAFTGTMAAGRAAEFYYRMGEKPSQDQLKEFYDHASDALKRLPIAIHRENDKETEIGSASPPEDAGEAPSNS